MTYLSRDNGLGSGRMAAIEGGSCLMGEGIGKFKSKEPVFLCSGSISIAPCISLSIGHEPALPWLEREDSSGPIAPCSIPSITARGSCVGDIDGGERDFFFVDAPARSFSRPLFFSFCVGIKQKITSEMFQLQVFRWMPAILYTQGSVRCLQLIFTKRSFVL